MVAALSNDWERCSGPFWRSSPAFATCTASAWLPERIVSGEHVTLRGLQAELAERGTQVDYRTVWNFVHAEGLSFKKNRAAKRAAPP